MFLVVLLIAFGGPVLAADPTPKKGVPALPAPVKKDEPTSAKGAAPLPPKRHGDWDVVCDSSDPQKEHCLVVQTQTIKENNARLIQVNMGKLGPQGEAVFTALVPLGHLAAIGTGP